MKSVVLLSPFLLTQRGNSITVARLLRGLVRNGVDAEAYGFCERPVSSINIMADIVHGFHAFHFGRHILPNLPAHIPLVLTMTGTDYNVDLYDNERRCFVLYAVERAAKVVVFHNQAKAQLSQALPAISNKVIVIPPGIDIRNAVKPAASQFNDNAPIVLIVAGLRKVKNVDLAVETVRMIRNTLPVNLLHVGPDIEDEVSARIRTAAAANPWFISLNELAHEQMAAIYRRASIVVNTSLSEAIPNSILEAMLLNRPVIVSNIPGNLSAVSHNQTGLVFSSQEEFAKHIVTLLQDRQLARRLGRAAGTFVRKNFDTAREVASYIRLYKEFAN